MNNDIVESSKQWDLATEKFFFYCMGLRKNDLRRQVAIMQSRYPDDSPEHLARRFIAAQIPLSLIGSVLVHTSTALPAVGPLFKFLGMAGGTTLMMTLNMTLIMQIALLYGYDTDDRARIKELLAVIAATGLASGSTLLIPQLTDLAPGLRALAGGAAIMTTSQLLGEVAIRYFRRNQAAAGIQIKQASAAAA